MTKLKMIPHDGGPCPVDGIVVTRSLLYIPGAIVRSINIRPCKQGDIRGWSVPDDDGLIKTYCPIEIEEEPR